MRWWSVPALGACLVGCGAAAPGPAPVAEDPPPPPLRLRVVPLGAAEDPLVARELDLVAGDVAERRAGRHGALPPVEAAEAAVEAPRWPVVEVVNATRHALVVWFAGPCPRTVGLAPRQRLSVELCAGDYDIAAQLDHPEFLPFVGQGDRVADGLGYRLTFYVVAEPGEAAPRLRRRR